MPSEDGEGARPFLVLDHAVHDYREATYHGPGNWKRVECRRNMAYGCGPLGDHIIKGLYLFVRLGRDSDPDRFPNLCISATEEVFHRLGSEIPDEVAEHWGRQVRLSSYIYAVSGNIMINNLYFAATNTFTPFQSYYLVYDSAAKSLSLFPKLKPHAPPFCETVCTHVLMPVPHQDNTGNYTLALMARVRDTGPSKLKGPVICLSLLTRRPPPVLSSLSSNNPWGMKARLGVQADPFRLEDVFMFKGKAVWSDLARGILYCDSSDLLPAGQNPVDFKFVLLPDGCVKRQPYLDPCELHVYRSIRSVRDSIWFVCIEPSSDQQSLGQITFKVWSVDLFSKEVKWKELREFTLQSVWELDGFREAALPVDSEPLYPILRQEDDGVLYFMLDDPKRDGQGCHVVGIDTRDSYELRLVSSRYIANPWISRPVVVPANFFSPHNTGF